jgi:hypothetical protein
VFSKAFALLTLVAISAAVSAQSFIPEYFAYPNPLSVVQGDLNDDGIPDFISEISGANELLSSGGGHFAARAVSHSGYYPIATGDFNRDGRTDAIFLNSLVVGYGDGHGGFSSFQTIPWKNGNQAFVEVRAQVADFNGDGRPDLAIAFDTYGTSPSFQVVVFINNGNGFNDGVTVYDRAIPPGANPGFEYTTDLDFVLGDFDADGHADLAFRTTESDPNNPATPVLNLIVFYGNGNGTFTTQPVVMTNYPVFEIAAADMNNDGTTDIVANGQSVIIFYGTRNRGFNSSTLAAAGDIAITPMLADFDGNGLKDVIYPSYNPTPGDNTIGVNALLQTSVGKFAQGKYVTFDSFNSGPGQVPFGQTFVGDYNRDGRPGNCDVRIAAVSLFKGACLDSVHPRYRRSQVLQIHFSESCGPARSRQRNKRFLSRPRSNLKDTCLFE